MNFIDAPEETTEAALPPDHPNLLAQAAERMPWKPKAQFPVARYLDAIEKLRERGYSFAEIAEWLNERLADKLTGTKITRAQVYHAFRFVLERHHREAEEAFATGDCVEVSPISDEEADKQAAAADGDTSVEAKPKRKGAKK